MSKQIRYTPEFKMQTVQTYLEADLSANQLALNLNIHPHTVRHWIQSYNDGKLSNVLPLDTEGMGIAEVAPYKQKELFEQTEIAIAISKISAVESEIKELTAIIKAYLLQK